MNNNIFATFMLGKVEEQLEIDCKAFSTPEKQNEEFEKIIETIETEKLKGDIKHYNKSKQDNFYHIHNGWFTCNTISFEVDKISGNLPNISAGDKIYISVDYEESTEENTLHYHFNTDISKLKEELKYKWDYYKHIDTKEPGMHIYDQDDNQIIIKGVRSDLDIFNIDEDDDIDVFMDAPSRMVTCFLKIFELTVE